MRLTDETVSKISVEDVWNKLVKWISPDDAEIERSAIYTFKSSLVKKWSIGNVFLAGDAAHLMPPFMGQGMCAGIRDVANLAWKLAAVINGADKAILKTYESERSPNVREFIDLTVRLGQIINQTSKSQKETTKMESILPSLGPGLGLRDNIEGQLAPQFSSIQSDKADDLNPNGFYPLSNQKNGMKLKGVEPWLNENNITSALVRPDGYILETVSKNKMLNNMNYRFDPKNNDLIKAVPSRKFIG